MKGSSPNIGHGRKRGKTIRRVGERKRGENVSLGRGYRKVLHPPSAVREGREKLRESSRTYMKKEEGQQRPLRSRPGGICVLEDFLQ